MAEQTGIRVLVVDDEPAIRDSLSEYLQDQDYQTVTAESAEQALELIERQSLDVAIVDLRLPGLDGDELIHRAHALRPELRFLIHTGSVRYHLTTGLAAIGMRQEHIFLKPLPDMDLLVAAIEQLRQGE